MFVRAPARKRAVAYQKLLLGLICLTSLPTKIRNPNRTIAYHNLLGSPTRHKIIVYHQFFGGQIYLTSAHLQTSGKKVGAFHHNFLSCPGWKNGLSLSALFKELNVLHLNQPFRQEILNLRQLKNTCWRPKPEQEPLLIRKCFANEKRIPHQNLNKIV